MFRGTPCISNLPWLLQEEFLFIKICLCSFVCHRTILTFDLIFPPLSIPHPLIRIPPCMSWIYPPRTGVLHDLNLLYLEEVEGGEGERSERNSYSKRTIPYSTEPFRTPLGHPHPLCYFLYPPPSTSATCCKERGEGVETYIQTYLISRNIRVKDSSPASRKHSYTLSSSLFKSMISP